jgi:hypothetical protein
MLFIEAMERSQSSGSAEQGCSNCVFDNALNYISEAIPREKMGDFNGSCYG